MNPMAETLTGWQQVEAVGQPLSAVFRILDARTRQEVESPASRVIREGTGVATANHTILLTREGRERRIEKNAAPIRDRQGRLAGVILVFRDITDRQRAEDERRQTEERLRLMVDSVKDYAIFSTDPQGRITSWNRGAERLFGWKEEDILGRATTVLFLPEDVARGVPKQELDQADREGRAEDERWHLRQDHSRFLASGVVTPVRDETGRLLGFTKVARDVTEKKQAEQEIARLLAVEQQQSDRLRQVAAAALSVNTALTRESVLRVITEEARRIIGAQQANGSLQASESSCELSVVSCQSGTVFTDNRQLTTDKCSLDAPLVGRNGRNIGLIQLSDKGAGEFTPEDEAILMQLSLIGSVAIENAKLYQEMRDADRRKDEFLATLAHELRNPLAPIRNALHLIYVGGDDPDLIARARTLMERQVQQMVRLIDDLLDLSRISRGRIELRKEQVSLSTIVQTALEASRPFIESAGHELTITLPPAPILLRADVTRLAQVIMNLLNNAAKYTERGGHIWLTASQEDDQGRPSANQVAIRVKDTGIGIPQDMLGRIFEMFAQVDRSLERTQGGLGIGLTLVRTLVSLHGGSVEARSAGPGQGSEFIVSLPIVPSLMHEMQRQQEESLRDKGQEGQTKKNHPVSRKGPYRILVVDDNRDSADSLCALLQMLGHEVATAHDGPAGVQVSATFQPEVVLLDIGLPGLNGYDVARLIRQQRGAGVVLAAITGWGHDEARRHSQDAGFDYHLVKPVALSVLQDLLDSISSLVIRR